MIFHGDKPRLPNIWIRRNYDYAALDICTQNIKVTYENNIPWGQTKITQSLGPQKMRLHLASIFATKHEDCIWKWYSMGANQGYSKSGFARNTITLDRNMLPRTYGLHMKMVFHGGKPRLHKIWIRGKYDYTRPQYFYLD